MKLVYFSICFIYNCATCLLLENVDLSVEKTPFTLICIKWVPGDPSNIFLATIFAQKMPERSGSMYSSILMLGNI